MPKKTTDTEVVTNEVSTDAVAAPKKRGWPKGKKRGPRKPKTETV